LDTSGYGAGFYNWDIGVGKIAFAWLGGLNDTFFSPGIGTFFKHTWELPLKDIRLGPVPGKFALVLIGNFEKGGTFTQGYDSEGRVVLLRNPVRTDSAWGIGGGAIYNAQFGPSKANPTNEGFNNSTIAYALFGTGATNFSKWSQPSAAKPAARAANATLTTHINFRRSTLSARAPAGSVNRKKGSDATVDISKIKNGDPVKISIIQVAALLWAATKVPEMTVAIQSLLKAGFFSAVQVELLFMIGRVQPGTKAVRSPSFRNFVRK
jgi:hypothetical protein